jgi:hypothetical protein
MYIALNTNPIAQNRPTWIGSTATFSFIINATTLIADTDNTNVPMAKAFSSVGWIQTETRIDLVPGP